MRLICVTEFTSKKYPSECRLEASELHPAPLPYFRSYPSNVHLVSLV